MEPSSQEYEIVSQAVEASKREDWETAFRLSSEGAALGIRDCHNALAHMLLRGQVTEPDPVLALQHFEEAGRLGIPSAFYYAGMIHFDGYGVEKSVDAAMPLFVAGARLNDPDCCYMIGEVMLDNQQYETAQSAFVTAAEQGHAGAMQKLAWIYGEGLGFERDVGVALWYNTQAAERGNASAQYNLGRTYERGIGTEVDADKAIHWYRAAAQGGIPMAAHNAASMLINQSAASAPEAIALFRQSAKAGLGLSYVSLFLIYEKGQGGPRDPEQAAFWLDMARNSQDPITSQALANLGIGPSA